MKCKHYWVQKWVCDDCGEIWKGKTCLESPPSEYGVKKASRGEQGKSVGYSREAISSCSIGAGDDKPRNPESFQKEEVSLCEKCNCMTHTRLGMCGKCHADKPSEGNLKTYCGVCGMDIEIAPIEKKKEVMK
jgi:hypothetical protein